MDLGLAGAISGAGEAGTKAIASAQNYVQTSALQAERDKMDMARQEMLLKANQGMNREKIQAEATQGDLTRKSNEGIHRETNATNVGIHNETNKTNTQIHTDTNAANQAIHDATNRTNLLLGKLQRDMQQKQFDKNFTAAKLDALKTTVRELGNEITRLSVVVGETMADTNSPAHKAAVEQLRRATQLHNLYAQEIGVQSNIDPKLIEKAIGGEPQAAFKFPPGMNPQSAPPLAGREPVRSSSGMVQMPMPGAAEQEAMKNALKK